MSARLRALKLDDLARVRAWRNHSNVSAFMCSQHIISEQEHQTWFEKNQDNPLKSLSLYEVSGEAMGFVQFDKKSIESDVYEWGFYIAPDAPKGTGFQLTSLALNVAFNTLKAHKVVAEVLEFNQASIQLHVRLGFVQEGVLKKHQFLKNHYYDVHCFGLLQCEFKEN
ncbi:MAG TPA: UDP-4-amino-4,6-dideoxy-N-acetyl-beta-L-altrosamine N-acetyltransferase [Thiomicrorhabdus sp.]|nr:UDP-4-amino-4,6-dideoxy-N-acetyl-beta-L-altrosamine N-acetyltransferase [Thiomicrorhabdus sp.]